MTLSEFSTAVNACCLIISVVGGVSVAIYIAKAIARYLKAKAVMMKYQIDMETDVSSIEDELEGIIVEALNYYTILNVDYRGDVVYINDAIENQIREGVTKIVTENLTDLRIARFGLIYNSAALADVIGKKVYLAVMNYRITFNRGKSAIPNETTPIKS
ncbi:MAG: hypothetical protein J6Y02_24085 [Pseudobutyrivibrio sp.]|nr:hypothetical protein [Pseudobutyrivibrio sp.]